MQTGKKPVCAVARVYLVVVVLLLMPAGAMAGIQLNFEWDPNPEPDIAGYRVFSRLAGEDYDYDDPDWDGQDVYCSIWIDNEGANYFFVVRAYDTDGFESDDSNEVAYTPTEDPPSEDPPSEDPPAEDPPVEDPPVEDPPAEDPPAEDPPAEDPPAEDPPAEDPPAEDPPVEDPPAEDPPPEDPPVEDPPIEDDPENLLVIDAATGWGQVYLYVDECDGAASVDDFAAIDETAVQDFVGRPDDLFLGLIRIELMVEQVGGTTSIPIYFSDSINEDVQWYTHDDMNGWQDYADHSFFSNNGMSVTLELKDGGFGDADGMENGVIVCTSGPSLTASSSYAKSVTGESPTASDSCFIEALSPQKELAGLFQAGQFFLIENFPVFSSIAGISRSVSFSCSYFPSFH